MAWKRHLSRSMLLALLAAIGYGVHLLLPPSPRWTLPGHLEIIGITADSRQFWTAPQITGYDQGTRTSFQLRDLSDGSVAASS